MPRMRPAVSLDPQVQAVLDKIRAAGNPEYWQMTPQQARDWHNRKAGILDVKPEPVFKTHDRSVPGTAGGIPVRVVHCPDVRFEVPAEGRSALREGCHWNASVERTVGWTLKKIQSYADAFRIRQPLGRLAVARS